VAPARLAGRRTRGHRQRSASFAGRRASPRVCRGNRRCALLQRFESNQCRCHVEGPGCFSRENPDCSRRKRQRQRLHLVAKAVAPKAILTLLIGAASEKNRTADHRQRGHRARRTIETRRGKSLHMRRGLATWCCWLRMRQLRSSFKISNTAAAYSKSLVHQLERQSREYDFCEEVSDRAKTTGK